MDLKSNSIFKFRKNIQKLKSYNEIYANKYLSSKLVIEKPKNLSNKPIQKVEFMPVDRLIREDESERIIKALKNFLPTGKYTSGKYIYEFEQYLVEYLSINHVIALSSGTSALTIGLIALGVKNGDEVILPSNSFAATENAVLSIGAIPVYADVKDDFTICHRSIENRITSKTKAILPVHLYDRFCDMIKVKEIAEKYHEELSNIENLILPALDNKSVWHLYPVRIGNNKRDFVKSELESVGVKTEIYYPYLSHKQISYKTNLSLPNTERLHKELLCLPLYPSLMEEEQDYVINAIKNILGGVKWAKV